MSFQNQPQTKTENLVDRPIPSNTLLHRVLTLVAIAVAARLNDGRLRDKKTADSIDQGSVGLRRGDCD